MEVSWNGYPKSPISLGFPIINHHFWDSPHLWKPPNGCFITCYHPGHHHHGPCKAIQGAMKRRPGNSWSVHRAMLLALFWRCFSRHKYKMIMCCISYYIILYHIISCISILYIYILCIHVQICSFNQDFAMNVHLKWVDDKSRDRFSPQPMISDGWDRRNPVLLWGWQAGWG